MDFYKLLKKIFNGTKPFIKTIVWLFVKSPRPSPDKEILIHIGCGEINIPGFINIDARPFKHVHILKRNISRLPFKNNSVSFIYMCHILEHIPAGQVLIVLKEMYRILKQDTGVLRLSVPDFDKLVDVYLLNRRNLPLILPPLLGGQDFKFNYHYSVFNKEHLSTLCRDAGFRIVHEWDPKNSTYHDFEDWASLPVTVNGKDFHISLNLEFTK